MVTVAVCKHHWVVEDMDNRVGNTTLNAVCKLCGATRTFTKFPFRDWGGRKQGVET